MGRARLAVGPGRSPARAAKEWGRTIQPTRCLGLSLILLAAGCGGSSAPAAQVSPTPDIAALRTQYLAIISPSNTATDGLSAALAAPGATPASVRPAAQKLLDADIKANTDLLSFQDRVPVSTRPDIASLRAALASDESDLQKVVAATTTAELNVALAAAAADGTKFSGAATLVRSDLGLPPA